jgi:hypothetical protein
MSLNRRIGLALLMCTSLVTMVASIMKAITLQSTSTELAEPQYTSSLAALWAGVEQNLVIIMASVPTLSAASKMKLSIFSRLGSTLSSRFSRFRSSNKGSSANSSRHYNDLELHPGATGTAPSISAVPLKDKSNTSVGVTRTDQFTLSYSETP